MGSEMCIRDRLSKDQELGYTRYGPHRGDISLNHNQRSLKGWLSRGQQKLLALLLLLAQQSVWQQAIQQSPIILLDDLYSELDIEHCERVIKLLQEMSSQVWITTTSTSNTDIAQAVFHVEQGQIHAG